MHSVCAVPVRRRRHSRMASDRKMEQDQLQIFRGASVALKRAEADHEDEICGAENLSDAMQRPQFVSRTCGDAGSQIGSSRSGPDTPKAAAGFSPGTACDLRFYW